MKYFRILFSAAALLLAASCIDNDVPYPVVELRIAGVEGSGFTVSGISIANRTVALTLDEKTDIRKVGIDKVTFDVATSNPMMTDTESFIGQIKTSRPLSGEFDLRSPLYVTLSLYQDYEWTIVAEQPIERAFTVAGQIGATVIDAQKRTATAYVPKGTNLGDITVTRLKLGPADITTYSPTAEELSASGFETMRFVDATYHGTTERWTLHVEHTDLKVAFRETDLWNNTGVITAMVTEEEYSNAVIQYRVKGTDEWQATQKGERDETGLFTAAVTPEWTNSTNAAGLPVKRLVRTKGVYAGQTYELRLLVNGEATETSEYTVPAGDVIPDGNMENPGLSCFTQENQNAEFWASGNNGFAEDLCTSAAFDGMGGSRCALLKASAPPIVGLAAGNLMSGIFYKDGMTTGVVEFGQPYTWTARPSGMKVKYHATVGIVNQTKHSGAPIGKGDQDKARIFVAIVDWNARHRVASGRGAPTGTWDPTETTATDEGKIIACGSLFIDRSTAGDRMTEITLPLDFYDTQARPTGKYSIVISCSTSAYGDFMVGCTTNTMYVDDFEWVY